MQQFIYADNAATTKLDNEAFEAMKPFLLNEYGNASQPYAFSRQPKKALSEARQTIATIINACPEEIFFTSGGTESDNWALKGTMLECDNSKKMITSQIEHHAVLNSAKMIEKTGHPVTYLPVTEDATITPETLKKHIDNETKHVSIMLSNNEVGSIQPIEELASIAHQNGALFHTDAVQSVGHIPVDVKELKVDMLSASAHKFNGPKGIGFLYIKKGTSIYPYNHGGAQEYGLRAGTENIAAIVGMATALRINYESMKANAAHLLMLEQVLTDKLNHAAIDYRRNGSSKRVPGNMSLSFRKMDGEMLLHRLDLKGICVSTGSACDSKNTQISHVLKAMNIPKEYALGTIRISFGKDNSIQDAETIADELVTIIKS